MGLDATVRCRCWKEGNITSPPPFAEHVRLNWDGGPTLDLPFLEHREKFRAFHDWERTCCAHRDMDQASARIANWSGLRFFQQQLQTFGMELFPTLQEVLPENNSGHAPAEKAAALLAELDTFCRQDFGDIVELIDVEANQSLYNYVTAHDGLVIFSREGVAGFGPSGYFVRQTVKDRVEKQEVFRSMAFLQEQIGPEKFKLTDLKTGRSVVTGLGLPRYLEKSPVTGKYEKIYPKQFEVRQRQMTSSDFEYILQPLRLVFKASLETGNPVRWH